MRVIYMPNSAPLPPPPKPKPLPPPPNIPLLIGGATGSIAGLGLMVRFKDFVWTYKWVILIAIILVILVAIFAWKSLKEDAPEEE